MFLAALVGWVFMVLMIDPESAGWQGIFLFYVLLWSIIASGINLLVRMVSGDEALESTSPRVQRFGILSGCLVVGLLIFQQFRVLLWWVGGLWFFAVLLAGLFFYRNGPVPKAEKE